jgi:uridine kinase
MEGDPSNAICLGDDGVLVVEGLHGLSPRISGECPAEKCSKVFIMPYGNVYCDSKLMDSNEIRLLRRIIRDYRHRSAHALATIDYWPMIQKSEEQYYEEYLTCADYHVNSFLAYESLIVAPMAKGDISEALDKALKGSIEPSVFMEKSPTGKPFADLSTALVKANKLMGHLGKIPVISPEQVPAESILNEFIGS